jgi:hypothetical protein
VFGSDIVFLILMKGAVYEIQANDQTAQRTTPALVGISLLLVFTKSAIANWSLLTILSAINGSL